MDGKKHSHNQPHDMKTQTNEKSAGYIGLILTNFFGERKKI